MASTISSAASRWKASVWQISVISTPACRAISAPRAEPNWRLIASISMQSVTIRPSKPIFSRRRPVMTFRETVEGIRSGSSAGKTTWAVINASIFSSIARRKLTSSTRSISSRDLFTTGSPR